LISLAGEKPDEDEFEFEDDYDSRGDVAGH